MAHGFGFGFTGAVWFYPLGQWTPDRLSNLSLWFRPEDLPASGNIDQWDNAADAANPAIQIVGTEEPVVETSVLDGYSAAVFDGVSDNFDLTTDITTSGAYHLFAVYQANLAADHAVMSGDLASERPSFIASDGSIRANNTGGSVQVSAISEFAADTQQLLEVVRDGSDVITGFLNGVDKTAGSVSSSGATAVRALGRRNTEFLGGKVVEALFVDGALSFTDRYALYNYLNSKYPSLSLTIPTPPGPSGDYLVTVGGDPVTTVGGDNIGVL